MVVRAISSCWSTLMTEPLVRSVRMMSLLWCAWPTLPVEPVPSVKTSFLWCACWNMFMKEPLMLLGVETSLLWIASCWYIMFVKEPFTLLGVETSLFWIASCGLPSDSRMRSAVRSLFWCAFHLSLNFSNRFTWLEALAKHTCRSSVGTPAASPTSLCFNESNLEAEAAKSLAISLLKISKRPSNDETDTARLSIRAIILSWHNSATLFRGEFDFPLPVQLAASSASMRLVDSVSLRCKPQTLDSSCFRSHECWSTDFCIDCNSVVYAHGIIGVAARGLRFVRGV
mmetsp:Transcript_27778/g.54559  ORF Transcript_27778/g.54559 Transcript_27778/m.54559 type:complete len:285 (-) Transcript_27778:108-962(-)